MDQSTDAPSLIPAADARYVAFLGVPVRSDGTTIPLDADVPCPWCCHWSHPLTVEARVTSTGVVVPLTYVEWIVYAWHVQHHQRGVPLA